MNSRYLPPESIIEFFSANKPIQSASSVNGYPIDLYRFGEGDYNIFAWSQMHGNESTTTRAIISLLQDIQGDIEHWGQHISLYLIPQLNPDGAKAYTRVNANRIDLNRDGQNLSQPESIFLRNCLESIKPDLCLNLHDQRSIFAAGDTSNTAIISFLSPSADESRTYNNTRVQAISHINSMVNELIGTIPNHIGRFDDSFNINCTGDMFTNLGYPTILIEAGHSPNDYNRNATVDYVKKALSNIVYNAVNKRIKCDKDEINSYLSIPENSKHLRDVIIFDYKYKQGLVDVLVQYEEVLVDGNIAYIPRLEIVDKGHPYRGHIEYNAKGQDVFEIHPKTSAEKIILKQL